MNDARLTYTYHSAVYAGKPVGEPGPNYAQGTQVN